MITHKQLVLMIFMSLSAISAQAKNYSLNSMSLLDRQTGDINKTIEAIAQHEATIGNKVTELSYTISLPSQSITELGLVLDFDNSEKGLKVLSVTPSSYADKLLIKSNDYIVKVNGEIINSSSSKLALKKLFNRPEKITEIAFKSAGIYQEVVIKLEALYLPEANLTLDQNNLSQQSLVQLEQLKQRIQGTLWTIAENEAKLGHDMRQFSYLADIPRKTLANLGLVISLDSESMGFRVLDILANSNAKYLGLEKGDLIISINHLYVLHASTNNLMNVLKNLSPDQEVTLGVLISNTEHFIKTKINTLNIPSINFSVGNIEAYPPFLYQLNKTAKENLKDKRNIISDEASCGIISIFKVRDSYFPNSPSRGQRRDPAISSIDSNINNYPKNSYVLSTGQHTVEITRINKGVKSIEINVEANKKYELSYFTFPKEEASKERLLSLKISNKYREPKFWIPFIRQEIDNTCNL